MFVILTHNGYGLHSMLGLYFESAEEAERYLIEWEKAVKSYEGHWHKESDDKRKHFKTVTYYYLKCLKKAVF